MAPTRGGASVQELAVDALAGFFSDVGCGAAAAAVRSQGTGCGEKSSAFSDPEAFVGRLRRLAASLGKLAADNGRGRSKSLAGADAEWATALRRKVSSTSSELIEAGPRSAHYAARLPGQHSVNFDPSIRDEYRDDLDPGYRVMEVSETDFLGGFQAPAPAAFDDELLCASKASMDELLCAVDAGAESTASTTPPSGRHTPPFGGFGGDGHPTPPSGRHTPPFGGGSSGHPTPPSGRHTPLMQGAGGPHPPNRGPPSPSLAATALLAEIPAFGASADFGGQSASSFAPGFRSESPGFGGTTAFHAPAFGGPSNLLRSDTFDVNAGFESEAGQKLPSFDSLAPVQPTIGIAGAPAFGSGPPTSPGGQDDAPTFGGLGGVMCTGVKMSNHPGPEPAFGGLYKDQCAPPPPPSQGCPVSGLLGTAMMPMKDKKRRRDPHPTRRHPDSGDAFYPRDHNGAIFDSFSLRVVYERDRTGYEESKEFPIHFNSIIAARYQVLSPLGEAAFSRAVKCLDLHTNQMVCMKIIKNNKDYLDQSFDEIKLLQIININTDSVDDQHCLKLIDYFYHKEHLIIVTELLHENLYEFARAHRTTGSSAQPYFTLGRVQRVAHQVLVALDYLHGLWLIHADLKPENILMRGYAPCEVKVIDFGSSCFFDDELSTYVCSRSYRAPEVILGLPYDYKIDVWALGCIVAELWTGYAIFQSDCIQSLLARIIGIVGPFPSQMLASGRLASEYFSKDGRLYREAPGQEREAQIRVHVLEPKRSSLRQRMRTDDEQFLDFLSRLLQVDPAKRPSAAEALQHPWLTSGKYPDGL